MNELSPAERSVSLQTDIELASLNPGSINYDQGVYVNSPSDIAYWAQEMHRRRIKPDMVIFDGAMIAKRTLVRAMRLAERGWIEPPYLLSFVLGQEGALPATARNLVYLGWFVSARRPSPPGRCGALLDTGERSAHVGVGYEYGRPRPRGL